MQEDWTTQVVRRWAVVQRAPLRAWCTMRSAPVLGLLVVPTAVLLEFVRQRRGRLQDTFDGRLFTAIVGNLRERRSLTSPVDHAWLTASPAEALRRLPRLPVPDVGPVYPLLVSVVPLAVSRAMWAVNLVSLLASLVMVAAIVRRASGSWVLGLCAQVLLVAGPIQQTIFARHSILSIAAAETYDVTAVAFVLGACLVLTRADGRRSALGAGWLLTLAALTRIAFAAVPLGFAVAALVRWRSPLRSTQPPSNEEPRATSHWAKQPVLAASLISVLVVALWQGVVAPFVLGSGSPKPAVWHPASLEPLLHPVLGWFGLEALVGRSQEAAVLPAGSMAVWLGWIVLRRPVGSVAWVMAVAAISLTVMVVAGRTFLVADLLLDDERHLLLVRIALTVVVLVELHGAVAPLRTRAPAWSWRTAGMGLLSVACAAGGSDPRLLGHFRQSVPVWASDVLATFSDDVVVMSSDPAMVLRDTGRISIDVLRPVEPSTGEARDSRSELAALARETDGRLVLVVELDSNAFAQSRLTDVACTALVSDWVGEHAYIQLVDISACGATTVR